MEAKVVSCLMQDRDSWNTVRDVISRKDFSDVGWLIVDNISAYYELDNEATYVDEEVLRNRLARSNPAMTEMVDRFLEQVQPVSAPNITNEYVEMRLASLSLRASHALSNKHNEEAATLVEEWRTLKELREKVLFGEEENTSITGFDVQDILAHHSADQLVPIYPESLNDAIGGGAPAGTHIVVFARPETGKTLFCVNLVANFIKNGKRALYCGNEDPRKSIQQRIMSNLLQMDRFDLEQEDPEYLADMLHQNNGHLLEFEDMHPGSVNDVRQAVARHRPDVVVVDQIRNLRTPRSFTKVEGLEYVAQEMRNIAKEYACVVVSVTQAGDSADGKLELTMGDVDYSNTGIPSTADLMIGIGVTPMLEQYDKRKLSLPKNKLTGDHSSIDVHVNTRLSEVS